MPSVLDLFNQPEVLNYLSNRQYAPYLGETLFPEVKRESLKFEMIKGGGGNIPTVASVHAFDTEAEIGSRDAYSQTMELALIKRKIGLNEEDIIKLENPRTAAEQQYLMREVFNDMDKMVNAVKARVEAMRMEVLAKGTVTINENKLNQVIDYHVPAENKQALSGTSLWTDAAADPLADLDRWATALNGTGTRTLTSTAVLSALLRHPKVVSGIFGAGSGRFLSKGELNNFLQTHQLPQIATYDKFYYKENANGTKTKVRYLPANAFVMFGDGTLGESIYGPTAEEIRLRRDPAIDLSKHGNVLGMVYEEGKDPVSTWTKAVATALPSFPAADEVFQATPIA
ncbi:major capsid protein [Metabacillus idriensis]|uniref:major capsid protein n=1 Tax=Metabacillus idriensis TaxID=324768 RepID=UPI00203A688C|nr:major capsid protein [Metabacillus idriensis]MCM3598703.1 major capsid protein [Metabacillus idriensis]